MLFHHYLEHKVEHKENDQDISLLDFIIDHYGESISKSKLSHNHDNEHEKLPFKSNDCGIVHVSIAYIVTFNFTFTYQMPSSSVDCISYSESFIQSSSLANIWQPPKLA